MNGVIVLQGGGPFVKNDSLDAEVLSGIDGYVAILPTADAFENPELLIAESETWAHRLDVKTKVCRLFTRSDASNAALLSVISGAAAVYIVGDSPMHLKSTLIDTPALDAICELTNSGIVVATGGSAAALCDPMVDPRGGAYTLGLGVVREMALITESETWSPERLARSISLADVTVVELPTGATLIHRQLGWHHYGNIIVHGELPTRV
jgi:cyanophycinase